MKLKWAVVFLLMSAICTEGATAEAARASFGGRSVSPGGKYVISWKQIGLREGSFPVFKCFLEKDGKSVGSIFGQVMADGEPEVTWSAKNLYAIVRFPEQVTTNTFIYSLSKLKTIGKTGDMLMQLSGDERYAFVLEDQGDDDNSSAWLSVMDMRSGKMSKVARINFGIYGDPFNCVWFGSTSRFAFIDVKGDAWSAEVVGNRSQPSISKRKLASGPCGDLRYIPGKGAYFVLNKTPYYSSDLRTIKKGALLPVKKARDQ